MSPLGQERRFRPHPRMSAIPPIATVIAIRRNGRNVPLADKVPCSKRALALPSRHRLIVTWPGAFSRPSRGLASTLTRLHHFLMQIREANVDDAFEACQIVRRSIAELCQADHQDDPIILEQWLSNNSFDNMRSWIADSNTYVVVATEGTAIIGVGAVTSSGEITLNYVSPDSRFLGVSKAILNQLEARARELGNKTCTLTSTETARRFYLAAGYVQFGPPEPGIGKGSSYRMVKQLLLTAQVRDGHQS
jgi:GNAT superfamily N-acetyltransferase